MARPRPTVENEPFRTTISLPTKVHVAAIAMLKKSPEIRNYSSFVETCIRAYAGSHFPDAIEIAAREIRGFVNETDEGQATLEKLIAQMEERKKAAAERKASSGAAHKPAPIAPRRSRKPRRS